MALECAFRLAPDIGVENRDNQFLLFMPWKPEEPILRLPGQLGNALTTIRQQYVASSHMEDLFTDGVSGNELIQRYFFLTSLKNRGFFSEKVRWDGIDMAEILPARTEARAQLPASAVCRLSTFAYLHRDEDSLVVESPLSMHKLALLHDTPGRVLQTLAKGVSPQEAVDLLPDCSGALVQALIAILAACGFVHVAADAVDEDAPPLATWEFHDLLFHTRSRRGGTRGAFGGTYRFLDTIPPMPAIKEAMSEEIVELHEPDMEGLERHDRPFTAVLEDRMSLREYASNPVNRRELGELLFRAARMKYMQKGGKRGDVSFRPYPAGGAIHELEIYPLVQHCDGLDPGLYRYHAKQHHLERLSALTEDFQYHLQSTAAAMGDPNLADSLQVLLFVTSRFPRLSWKYQSMAYATTLKTLGCLYQTLYLVTTAMDLAPCAIGGGDSAHFAATTGIDPVAEPLIGEFVIGRPRD